MPETEQFTPEKISTGQPVDYPAEGARILGDALTETRDKQTGILGTFILAKSEYQSVGLAIATAAEGVGDWLDGRFKRFWARRTGTELTPEDARKDEKEDKKGTHRLLAAITLRELLNKEYKFAGFLALNLALIMGRDAYVSQARDEGQANGAFVGAEWLGKGKTGLQNTEFTHQTSPFAKTKPGRKVSYGLQSSATALSLISGFTKIRSMRKNRGR
ncbi:MAG TPA: hypothetical protein VFW77_04745 [Candidatus Saccharimonadales bacterium]|nr:hypothetical protein [Candidatus Saccharimonadales bacterium]